MRRACELPLWVLPLRLCFGGKVSAGARNSCCTVCVQHRGFGIRLLPGAAFLPSDELDQGSDSSGENFGVFFSTRLFFSKDLFLNLVTVIA